MTRAIVVYESILGNTQDVARAVADGLGATLPVTVTEVGQAPDEIPPDVGLVVVGGPTHAFGLSRPETRRDAAAQATGPVVSTGRGIREWLETLKPVVEAIPTATFDTRVLTPHVPGSAAKKARKRLKEKGFAELVGPESFHVHGKAGPLADGEQERARQWGEELARRFETTQGGSASRRV
jgi:flavodoxin